MFLFRKNIILVPSDYDGVSMQKGILCMDCFNGMSKCSLKCYNVDMTKKLVLGVCIDGKLAKYDIEMSKSKSFEFVTKETIEHTSEISAVLLDIGKDDYKIVLWGSTQINLAWQNTLKEMIEENYVPKPVSSQQQNNNFDNDIKSQNFDNKSNYCDYVEAKEKVVSYQNAEEKYTDNSFENNSQCDITEEEKLDNFIDSVIKMTEDDSVVDETTDSQINAQSTKSDFDKNVEIETDLIDFNNKQNYQTKTNLSFYEKLSGQIQKMFDTNESFEVLNEIFPNSKFCKVNFDDGTGYYVFGIIYDEGQAKYLCYGMPAQKEETPPKEFAELYQWLPIDTSSEEGDGFYMMYQDAQTGRNISVDII